MGLRTLVGKWIQATGQTLKSGARPTGLGAKVQAPIFIVGCGHSGTSLLLAILGAHSRIHPIPNESNIGFQEPGLAEQLRQQFDSLTVAAGKCRWVEKTPKHINCMDRLWTLSADAKVLLIIRDGRDVACSLRDRVGSLSVGIERWMTDNKAGEKYWGHPQVYRLKYEDIIDDFDKTIAGVLEFLGEEFETDMREYHKRPSHFYSNTIAKPPTPEGKNHNQYRNWQINQPLFDGRGKWHQLNDEEKACIKQAAGDMLARYGYATDQNW